MLKNLSSEYRVAAMMACTAMFTLIGYEFMRSASTVLFKSAYGAENLPLVMAAMPVVVFLGVALYGWILSQLGPRRTLIVTTAGSGLLILCGYLLVLTGNKMVTPVLFLLKEFYIVLLIEQYWSYINSSLKEDTAKRVNGPITGVAGFGSVIGGFFVAQLAQPLGTESMILLAAFALIPAGLMANWTYAIHGEPEIPVTPAEKPKSHLGWHLFRENPTLSCLLAIVLSTQVIAAVLDFKFQELLSLEFAGQQDAETAFQGQFWFYLNSSAVVSQFLITPLLLTYLHLRWAHLLMPAIHLVAITVAIVEPTVISVGLAFFLFKAFDYSLFRSAKELLYIPLEFDARYRAKEVIDVFGYRTGKGGSSVVIVLLQKAGVVMSNYYLAIGLVMVVVWLALIGPLTRQPAKSAAST